ncbi:MAG: integrase, partial [Verrucomicrobiaceae bacterium]
LMRAGEIEVNPAYSVKGPRMSVTGGKTPAFDADNARKFLESIDGDTIKDKRDRALICLMMYSFARISAALQMDAPDYFQHNDGYHLRINEKGGKVRTLPAHSALVAAMAEYLEATELRGKPLPLWQTIDRKTSKLSGRRLSRTDAYQMLTDRAREAGFTEAKYGNHTWRATGITAFLDGGGAVDLAQQIAGHADPRTTGLYDRRQDRINQGEIERIRI